MGIRFFILERVAPVFTNKQTAAEFRKRVPDILVKHGFDVAMVVSLAADEIEKETTRKGRQNIERNLKAMIIQILEERKKNVD
jgi:hypothetical protein